MTPRERDTLRNNVCLFVSIPFAVLANLNIFIPVENSNLPDSTQKHERRRSYLRRLLSVARRTRQHPTQRRLQVFFECLRNLRLLEDKVESVRRVRITAARHSSL